MAKADPVQRQLLGDISSPLTWYLPAEGDVPLRAWLHQHQAGATAPHPEDPSTCG